MSMDSRWAVMVAVLALASPLSAHAVEPNFQPPEGSLHRRQDFQGVQGIPTPWQAVLGSWQADGRTYNSTSAVSPAVTTIFEYKPVDPVGEVSSQLQLDEFIVRARLRNERGGASDLVGIVYLYFDPANYDEVVFSPTGIAYLRRMIEGNLQIGPTATYAGGGQGVWFSVELERTTDTTSVRVNGVPVFKNAPWGKRVQFGQVGLSTYNTTARFNKISISLPWGQQAFTENFSDGVAAGFDSANGTFIVSGGTFNNTAVRQTNASLSPIDFGSLSTTVGAHSVHVRMFNPYGGSGNLVGLTFSSISSSAASPPAGYDEVVFSPTGVAQIRRIIGSTITVLHTASHPARRNEWFDVTFVLRGGLTVSVNGEPVFVLAQWPEAPSFMINNSLSLITHWSPGRFDDFSFSYDTVLPLQQPFDTPLVAEEIGSGTWNTQGGTLNNISAGVADIVLPGLNGGGSGFRHGARMLNQYGASGNLVGLVFSYQSPGDYLEAVFAPTGQAYLHLYIEGTRYRLATGTHNIGRNVWFDAEVIRTGTLATITVNGVPVIQNVQTGHLGRGALGLVTHWARARFDNMAARHALR